MATLQENSVPTTLSFGAEPVIMEDETAGQLADVDAEQVAERPDIDAVNAPASVVHGEPDGVGFGEGHSEPEPNSSDEVDEGETEGFEGTSQSSSEGSGQGYRDRVGWLDPGSYHADRTGLKLATSVIDYVRALEDRIHRLESAEEQRQVREPEESSDTEEPPRPSVEPDERELVLETKFYHVQGEIDSDGNFKDNSEKSGAFTCATDPKHLIRVLYEWADDHAQGPTQASGNCSPNPEVIEVLALSILSVPIAKFFAEQTGLSTDNTSVIRMTKPFRPLLRNHQLLRGQLEKLEDRFGSNVTNPNDKTGRQAESEVESITPSDSLPFTTTTDTEAQLSDFDSYEALAHFRMLVGFIDTYLARQVKLLSSLKAAKEDKIAFENLWMLFDAGDTIYCPFSAGREVSIYHTAKPRYVPQCFRVLGTRGGLPTLKSFAPKKMAAMLEVDSVWDTHRLTRLMMRESKRFAQDVSKRSGRKKQNFGMLFVVCFHIDFDGNQYGTVSETFSFKPYNGMMDIRSLEAYPIQYLRTTPESAEKAVDMFIERGRKFIDTTMVSHLSYEGLTVGRSREEIISAVMVDFKRAFTEYSTHFAEHTTVVPMFTSLAENWISPDAIEPCEFYYCNCGRLWCYSCEYGNDAYYQLPITQTQRLEPELKLLLEEHDTGMPVTRDSLERFKDFMEDNDLIGLLPGVVPGFALRNRKWVQLDLDRLTEIEQIDEWNNLVLPKGHRDMVQAMVETHTRGAEAAFGHRQERAEMDLVRGKGKGCIILLHGVPGVGKTSTAECVASYTQRPLYPITCGDIGYSPQEVEENMEKHFKLAHAWGCVLLLDEADVFLAKRNKQDVKRNGLVSVFLRILEYYSGILFLTTNRVGAIDDAFRSRLHLTLYYPKLTEKQTRKIWKNNLERMKLINRERQKRGQLPVDYDRAKILKWVELNWDVLQWNGRQIRNAFQTAIALAEFRGSQDRRLSSPPRKPVMDVSHFKQIADASMQFNDYLLATHNADEDETALRDKIRPKTFNQSTKLRDLEEDEESSGSSAESDPGSGDGSADDTASEDSESEEDTKRSEKAKKKSSKTASKSSKSEKKRTEKKETEGRRR